jgi:hypothetical protein
LRRVASEPLTGNPARDQPIPFLAAINGRPTDHQGLNTFPASKTVRFSAFLVSGSCADDPARGAAILKSSAAMIGGVPLIGDTRLLRFQPRIFRGARQEVIFMFRRDSDSVIQR